MKTIFKPMLFTFFIMLSMVSCSDEEVFIEPTVEIVDDTDTDPIVNTSLPCDFTLTNVEANATIIINCILDLEGQTVNLPDNVSIIYDGGDIINGTLNFSDGNIISGELLNSSLALVGSSTPQLEDPVFNFIPSRWEIVEGLVSDEVARTNRDVIKYVIYQLKEMGALTFKIDVMDAYFKVDEPLQNAVPQDAAISIPSNFSLIMTENTHLRMQPNAYKQPTLMSVTNGATNVVIDGGYLHGDRDEHDYSDGGTHEWGHLLRLKACSFVTVKNVTFMDATGDGIDISALGHSFSSNYNPSYELLITDNTFIRNRRNNLSITDGRDIIIENNEFIDAGVHTNESNGTAPSFAIDVEAVRGSSPEGPQQISQDIIIRNNIERGSRIGGFTVHTGDRVTIEGNQMENFISYSTSIGTIIRNNTLTSTTDRTRDYSAAIIAGREDRYDNNYNNSVYGNTIIGFSTGIRMTNTDLVVYNNTITDCKTGIVFETITNSKVYGNIINSTRVSSDGIVSGPTEYMDNIVIGSSLNEGNIEAEKNIVEVTRSPFKFVNVNNELGQEDFSLIINNNEVKSTNTSTFSNTHGFYFSNNLITQGGVRLVNVKNANISNNIITSTTSHGIRLDQGCSNININNQNITVAGNFQCITQTTSDGINIEISNLDCN